MDTDVKGQEKDGVMENVILTIIIPVYNKENLLRQCLDSFADETFAGKLEVLAIDDGSQDASLSILTEYSDRYPQIYRVISKENGGVGSVWNLGLQCASGKYVKEVDADDYVDTGVLKKLLVFLEDCHLDIVINPFRMVNETGICMRTFHMMGVEYGRGYAVDTLLDRLVFSVQSLTIRRGLFFEKGIQLEETRYYVDMQLVGEAVYYAETAAVLDGVLYYYRLNQAEQSVSLASYVKHAESFRRQAESSLERFERAQKEGISEARQKTMKSNACGYSAMLYTIYLMDREEDTTGQCRDFDGLLQDKYPLIYAETGKRPLIYCLREADFENVQDCKERLAGAIEELKRVNKGNVRLGDVCALGLGEKEDIAEYQRKKQSDRLKKHCEILNHWLMNLQKGSTVGRYLAELGFHKVAIYGFGDLGQRLYQELLSGEVQVVYGMDRRVVSEDPAFTILTAPDAAREVDAVIVTAMIAFPGIAATLRETLNCPIISLEDVIYRSC